jgi:hypothetical protein
MFSCHPFRAAEHALVTSSGPEALVGTIRPWSVFKRSEVVEGFDQRGDRRPYLFA